MTRRFQLALGALGLAVAGAVAAALVLVFSGGGGKLTKAEYIAKVNAVCRDYNEKLAGIQAPIGLANLQAIAQSICRALPLVEERAAKARKIEPPDELAPRVRHMFALSDQAIGQLRASRQAALAGKLRDSAVVLGRFLEISGEAHRLALHIGLSC